jgi:precorrin-2/cobalt-factor-2 C20-methyltransferase
MKAKFYGIGVGPGDPELITMKAVHILAKADVVAVPESSREKGSVAWDIARPYLRDGVEMLSLTFPMIRDVAAKQKIREENARLIHDKLEKGLTVAFLTLGDPMLYSTYIYLLENLIPLGISIETIPGIYSFAAISNLLNMPLVKGDEKLAVISSLDEATWVSLQAFDTIVCMKVTAYRQELSKLLKLPDAGFRPMTVSNVGNDAESVSSEISVLDGELPYFTTVILLKK